MNNNVTFILPPELPTVSTYDLKLKTDLTVCNSCLRFLFTELFMEKICGVDPLPLQSKDFAQKEFLELLLVPYYSKLLTTLFRCISLWSRTGLKPAISQLY